MADWDSRDVILVLVASYIAVTALVRLMRNHHKTVMGEMHQQLAMEQRRRTDEEKKKRKSERQQNQRDEAA